MRPRLSLLASALLLAVPAALSAQDCDYDYDDCGEWHLEQPTGGYFGGSFTVGSPQGEFADFVDRGLGGDLHYVHRLGGGNSQVAIRFDGGILNYGYDQGWADDGGGWTVDVTTTNNIAFIGVGPQIGLPDGRLRPYVNAHAGYSFIWTSTTVDYTDDYYDDYDYDDGESSVTYMDDWSFSYGAGAGLYIPVRRGDRPVSIDLGVRYHNNGQSEYLREGDIVDNNDGTVSLFPVRSDTDLLTFHIGVSVGISR